MVPYRARVSDPGQGAATAGYPTDADQAGARLAPSKGLAGLVLRIFMKLRSIIKGVRPMFRMDFVQDGLWMLHFFQEIEPLSKSSIGSMSCEPSRSLERSAYVLRELR